MECETPSNGHLPAQQGFSESLLHKLPTNPAEFDDWLRLLQQQGNALDPLNEANLIVKAIRSADPSEAQLTGLDDLQKNNTTKPLHVLRQQTKEQIRLVALSNLRDSQRQLLMIRGYIQQDKLRVINLEQKYIELWKGLGKDQLATIYSRMTDVLFLASPETVVAVVSFVIDQKPELLKRIELHSSTVADRVLTSHSDFKLQTGKQKAVFKWLFRQSSTQVKRVAYPHYARLLGTGSLVYLVELMAIAVKDIPYEVAITAQNYLKQMLTMSSSNAKAEGLVFEVLRGLVHLNTDLHIEASRFLIESYHNRKRQFTRAVLEFVSECLNYKQNVFFDDYLQVLLIEIRRHLVEDDPAALGISVEILLKLIESGKLRVQQIKELCSGMFTIIEFRRCGRVTLNCLAVLHGMMLVDYTITCEMLKELNKEEEYLSLLTNDACCEEFTTPHIEAAQLDPFRRLYVLAAVKVFQWPLSSEQFMPVWYEVLKHCDAMASAPKPSLININQRSKLEKNELQTPDQAESDEIKYKPEGLLRVQILYRDEFGEIHQAMSGLSERYGVDFPFSNYHRVFHEEGSAVRQVVKLKHN